VLQSFDKGLVVSLSEEVEAFVPRSHAEKSDGSLITEGEKLLFRIIDFSSENKKIVVSHSATYKEVIEEQRKKTTNRKKKVMKKLEDEKKHSTLGDLDSLAALKDNLES
jgi:small subunit ribosomal protein S1